MIRLASRMQIFLVGLGVVLIALLCISSVAYAVDPFKDVCAQGGGDSAVCTSRKTTDPVSEAIGNVTSILALVAGIISVIYVVVGGFKYITSNGDSSAIATAKSTIIYALVGLVVALMARPLINFVLGKL